MASYRGVQVPDHRSDLTPTELIQRGYCHSNQSCKSKCRDCIFDSSNISKFTTWRRAVLINQKSKK